MLVCLVLGGVFLSSCTTDTAGTNKSIVKPSDLALGTADYALETYREEIIETLSHLVAFATVKVDGVENIDNPEFKGMTDYLRMKSEELGLEFQDHGAVVIISLGESGDRLGLITHGDVQPADSSKWRRSPFELDVESEPDRLIARGTEDDKGPIAIALYAMKALKDKAVELDRRVELIISYTEESDWTPMVQFLEGYEAPQLNIALDSRYPVVTAEKGWCTIQFELPLNSSKPDPTEPFLKSFTGGAFMSQVPEDAVAVIENASDELRQRLENAVSRDSEVQYTFQREGSLLTITALGKSAHSSEPKEGVNAISHLGVLLASEDWPESTSATYVKLIDDLIGTGYYGEKFGDIAYSHEFMGPLTLSLSLVHEKDDKHILGINLRRPAGKEHRDLEDEIRLAIKRWQEENNIGELPVDIYLGDPHLIEDAPHIPVLLGVFSHYTGEENPQPLAASGGTHARLLPNGVSFGPHMPGRAYSGHSEYEYLLYEELDLDIKMYTAMLVDLVSK